MNLFEKVPAGLSYLPLENYQLRVRPHEDRPKCSGGCVLLIVNIDDNEHRWRCRWCLRYVVHEMQRSLF